MTYRESIAAQEPNMENLQMYLDSVHPQEWNRSEYKAYSKKVGDGLAREVAAMANTKGGEVFIGVDDDRSIKGTRVSENDIKNSLRKEGAPTSPSINSDLTSVVEITKVDLKANEMKVFVYVLEVRPNGKISIARDKTGTYEVYIRRGESTERAQGWEVVGIVKSIGRETMLRSLYSEMSTLNKRLSHGQHWQHLGLGLELPYLQSIMEDGTIYEYLTPEDIEVVLGTSKDGTDWVGGCYRELIELRARMRFQFNHRTAGWDR